MSARFNRQTWIGLATIVVIAGLIYLSGRREREVAVDLKPFVVHLVLSEDVKRQISATHADLEIRVDVTDQDPKGSAMGMTVLDHQDRLLHAGESDAKFFAKHVDVELARDQKQLDPVLSISVVSRLSKPAGNCIRCEPRTVKLAELAGTESQIDIRCDGWLSFGICNGG